MHGIRGQECRNAEQEEPAMSTEDWPDMLE